MRAALNSLGFMTDGDTGYQSQFGITVSPPQRMDIGPVTNLLLATVDNGDDDFSGTHASTPDGSNDGAAGAGDINQGDNDMFYVGSPPVVPVSSTTPVVTTSGKYDSHLAPHVFGVCTTLNSITGTKTAIGPASHANTYMYDYAGYRGSDGNYFNVDKAEITLVEPPKHGRIVVVSERPGVVEEDYVVDAGYEGEDVAVFRVSQGGVSVTVKYYFVMSYIEDYRDLRCTAQPADSGFGGGSWKISRVEVTPEGGAAVATFLSSRGSSVNVAGALLPNFQFANLFGASVGMEQVTGHGASITLDTDAAGYGWFVDSTPADNTEFLPTSNPNEWIAKVGGPAYGTMDLYTVLLHEYGHALGLDHSPDSHDFMAAALQPGVLHVLSEADLATITQLAGLPAPDPGQPLPGLPYDLSLMALMLRRKQAADGTLAGASSNNTLGVLAPHYDVVVSPTLANSDFNGTTGWTTSGDVTMASGSAVLGEPTTTQTRINQVFTVGANDQFPGNAGQSAL
jgi:hypothetical protein